MEPQTWKFENMGQFQNPLLPGTPIIEEQGNHGHQQRLHCSCKWFLWMKYSHPNTGIPHQDSGDFIRYGICNIQRLKCLRQTHPVQCNTQLIQRYGFNKNGRTLQNYGNTRSKFLHHGHKKQQYRPHRWKTNTYFHQLSLPPTYYWLHIWCKNSSK